MFTTDELDWYKRCYFHINNAEDGNLTAKELVEFSIKVDDEIPMFEIDYMFSELDRDLSGGISFPDFF